MLIYYKKVIRISKLSRLEFNKTVSIMKNLINLFLFLVKAKTQIRLGSINKCRNAKSKVLSEIGVSNYLEFK